MFLDGMNDTNDLLPDWWVPYVHHTLVRCTAANRPDLITQWCTAAGGTEIYNSPGDDNLLSGVTMVRDATTAVVAFQGTANVQQLYSQVLQSPQSEFAGIPGSLNGYYAACFIERYTAFAAIINALPAGTKLFFSGHSAGGAIAHVAFNYFAKNGPWIPHGCITLGQPRTGNAFFCLLTPAPFLRIVTENDFVPSVPPSLYQTLGLLGEGAGLVLGQNYDHARSGWLLMNDGTALPGYLAIEDQWGPPLANDFLRLRNAWPAMILAHDMANYSRKLLALAQRQHVGPNLAPFVAINNAI